MMTAPAFRTLAEAWAGISARVFNAETPADARRVFRSMFNDGAEAALLLLARDPGMAAVQSEVAEAMVNELAAFKLDLMIEARAR